MKYNIGDTVTVDLYDGQVKSEKGRIIGGGINSKGETAYLVEMESQNPPQSGTTTGIAQVEHGKCWMLSVYEDELTPTTRQGQHEDKTTGQRA